MHGKEFRRGADYCIDYFFICDYNFIHFVWEFIFFTYYRVWEVGLPH